MELFFKPKVKRTIDQADQPLNFTTCEYSYGKLNGSILLNNELYTIIPAEGYTDHMIPVSNGPWPADFHGWDCAEVTTDTYQVVVYAIRGLEDGYTDYSYKHLTLLNRHSGKVIREYSGNEITITESTG